MYALYRNSFQIFQYGAPKLRGSETNNPFHHGVSPSPNSMKKGPNFLPSPRKLGLAFLNSSLITPRLTLITREKLRFHIECVF